MRESRVLDEVGVYFSDISSGPNILCYKYHY